MTSRAWSSDEIKCLIIYYESLPELWQITNPDYKNRVKKTAAVEKLADQFDTSAMEINRKLHNLRTQFNNELRKIKKKKSGQSADENYTSTWEFFTSLNFLTPTTGPARETRENLNSPPTKNNNLESSESTQVNTFSESQRTSKKRKKEDEVLERALILLDKSDDATIFGDFVAGAIRNMRSEARKRELKRKVQRIILDMEELDEADQYSTSAPHTPMPNTTWESTEDSNLMYEHF